MDWSIKSGCRPGMVDPALKSDLSNAQVVTSVGGRTGRTSVPCSRPVHWRKTQMQWCLQHLTCLSRAFMTLVPVATGHATPFTVVDQLAELQSSLAATDCPAPQPVARQRPAAQIGRASVRATSNNAKNDEYVSSAMLSKKYSMCPGVANDSL